MSVWQELVGQEPVVETLRGGRRRSAAAAAIA